MSSSRFCPGLSDCVVDQIEVGIFAVNRAAEIVLWNRFMEVHSRKPAEEVLGRNLYVAFPELPQKLLQKKFDTVFVLKNYAFTSWEQRPYLFRFDDNRPITGGESVMRQSCSFFPVMDETGEVTHICVTVFDYSETAHAQAELKRLLAALAAEHAQQKALIAKLEEAHHQLLQSEKLASIGQLAAGVAHEINNPIGFVNSNVGSFEGYLTQLFHLIDAYQDAEAQLPDARRAELAALKDHIDLPYLREDACALVRESKDGLDRVKRIVQALKDFSRIDSPNWEYSNLHQCLDSTLNVVWNELKYKAEVCKEYGPLPEVECMPSQLNQVFMNLLVNAAHAIVERGRITISTRQVEDWVCVAVSDTGVGIPPENLKRIFDPFFTTKPVGKGTGLGLSISYNIVAKHHGRIDVDSVVGQGTTFRVWLPVSQAAAAAEGTATRSAAAPDPRGNRPSATLAH